MHRKCITAGAIIFAAPHLINHCVQSQCYCKSVLLHYCKVAVTVTIVNGLPMFLGLKLLYRLIVIAYIE